MNGLDVGDRIPPLKETATLATSVRYAGASGDLNPLHYDQAFAADVSPTGGVIAHGMYSMGLAARLATSAAGGPEHVVSIDVRFARPWPLGSTATFTAEVTDVTDGVATLALRGVTSEGQRVLRGSARIRV